MARLTYYGANYYGATYYGATYRAAERRAAATEGGIAPVRPRLEHRATLRAPPLPRRTCAFSCATGGGRKATAAATATPPLSGVLHRIYSRRLDGLCGAESEPGW